MRSAATSGAGYLDVEPVKSSRNRWFADSPLEGNGFELPVPGREAVNRDGRRTGCPEIGTDLLRNRRSESISLQQGVTCELVFGRDAEGERYLSLLVTSASSTFEPPVLGYGEFGASGHEAEAIVRSGARRRR